MNDRELLELAAEAAGIPVPATGSPWEGISRTGTFWWAKDIEGKNVTRWNPLTNDGDALRLAVRLGLSISADVGLVNATIVFNGNMAVSVVEKHNSDPESATRRAIVRAAAEIGKSMGTGREEG